MEISLLTRIFFLVFIVLLFLQNTLKYKKIRPKCPELYHQRFMVNTLVYFLFPGAVQAVLYFTGWNQQPPANRASIVFTALGVAVYHLYSIHKLRQIDR